jgi:hypothetical protein
MTGDPDDVVDALWQMVDSRDAVPVALGRAIREGCNCSGWSIMAITPPPGRHGDDWWGIGHAPACRWGTAMTALHEAVDDE